MAVVGTPMRIRGLPRLEAVVALLLAHLPELVQERCRGCLACAGADRSGGALRDRRHRVPEAPVVVADELRPARTCEDAQRQVRPPARCLRPRVLCNLASRRLPRGTTEQASAAEPAEPE